MNRNDDFDQTLAAWLRREAPPQAPDRMLDAALQRVASQSQRRGWLQRLVGGPPMTIMIRAAAVGAVVAIAVLIGFGFSNLTDNVGDSPSPSASASAEPAASSTPGASPSLEPSTEPSAAALVLELLGAGEAGNVHLVTILDDGRVISSDPSGLNPPTERVLTAEGVQLVRDEMEATGLIDASANYTPIANPGVEAPGYGGAPTVLSVGQAGGDQILVSWYLFGDPPEQDYFQPQPEAEALDALAARLTTLEEWLPASAWADASPALYEPESYHMVIGPQPLVPGQDIPIELSAVAWPLDDEIAAFGEPIDEPSDGARCGVISADDGTAVIEALVAVGAELGGQSTFFLRSFAVGDQAHDRVFSISVQPILIPDTGC